MISHSLKLINEFIKMTKYNEDDFKESDFILAEDNILEAHKDQTITYKEFTFPISFFVLINEITDELYCISFNCYEVNQDNHIIVSEYLTQMMCLIIDFISDEMFLNIDENEFIIDFFQAYLEERKEGHYALSEGITSISQGHFVLSHSFYNQVHHVYLNAVAHRRHTLWLQVNFIVEYMNKNIDAN